MPLKITLLSDFNLGNLAGQIRANEMQPILQPELLEFGQLFNFLTDRCHTAWNDSKNKILFIWASPEAVLPNYANFSNGEAPSWEILDEQLESYLQLIINAASLFKFVFVPTFTCRIWERLRTDELTNHGQLFNLMRINLKLVERLSAKKNIKVLNSERWLTKAGDAAHSPRLWYMAKIPFSNDVFTCAAEDIKWHVRSILGGLRKLIICDLDDTLWGGILGDDGWENLRIGGHDAIGESFKDFQKSLKRIKDAGILLAIASKNDEATALSAMASHPEMVLQKSDFVAWRINWEDKARNVADILKELNLGPQSAIFLDDNPVERARVREMHTEVLVPEMPENKLFYLKTLLSLDCLDLANTTDEDRLRTELYQNDKNRESARSEFMSVEDWISTLNMSVDIARLSRADLARATQLLNKTNQLNLTTRRMTEDELWNWANADGNDFFLLRVKDRFGDLGIVGLLSTSCHQSHLNIDDFVLSCRVIGRKVEETMLWLATEIARAKALHRIEARYIETSKNKPIENFFERSGWTGDSKTNVYNWNLNSLYPKPSVLHVALKI